MNLHFRHVSGVDNNLIVIHFHFRVEDRGVSTRVGLLTPDAKGMDLVLTVVREFMALNL